jgi:DNA-binding Lrp family transcriptional regulator
MMDRVHEYFPALKPETDTVEWLPGTGQRCFSDDFLYRGDFMRQSRYRIDETGGAILLLLERDAKTPVADIARQLNLDEDVIRDYITRFENDRIIVRYSAHVNWDRIRDQEVKALIEVKVTPEHGVGFDSIAENIYRFSEVSSVILLSGGYDLLVEVEGQSLREVAMFVSEKLAPIKGVQSTVTHFHLKTYKEKGQILVEEPGSKRLPFSF